MNKILILILFLLTSCVETVVVGTIVTGSAIVQSRKPSYRKDIDEDIKIAISKSFLVEDDKEFYKNIRVNVFESRIMLTGYVKDEKYKKNAVKKAITIKNGAEIIDEILIIPTNNISSETADSLVSKQIWIKLKVTDGINSSNYEYEVVDGVVYIIGKSEDKKELIKTTNTIARVKGVNKVISYIDLND
ncbi:MAG: BON domain-containing protein [Rickettsiales bacterium]|jgi:osmotically-inducible protein OsmY|nr:BON domain-containing protein [Rickettsiales bacterium]